MTVLNSSYASCKKVCELCPGEQIGSFVAVDYVLFAAVLAVSALIGVLCSEFRNYSHHLLYCTIYFHC
jgi:hypothetical protein